MDTPIEVLIADDEQQLRSYLAALLKQIWPETHICAEVDNGFAALTLIEKHQPAVAFLDVQMPGLSGIEVARQAAADCIIVFVTAYDDYAVEAFASEAIDYLLKPVNPERLAKTVSRLKKRIADNSTADINLKAALDALLDRQRAEHARKPDYLQWIRAQHGSSIRLIAVQDIIYFKAADKYTCVITREEEFLIRMPIKTLAAQLDPALFWQIHRGHIVRVDQIAAVSRSLTGRYVLRLKDTDERLTVSRNHAHLFKQM